MTFRSYGPDAADAAERSAHIAGLGHLLGIQISAVPGAGNTTRGRISATGLIDTGATDVCIDYRIAQELELKQIDQTNVGVVGGSVLSTVHMAMLEVPEIGFAGMIRLFALKVRRPTHDVLLGRSFLKNFIVTFDGPSGLFHFQRPIMTYEHQEFDE